MSEEKIEIPSWFRWIDPFTAEADMPGDYGTIKIRDPNSDAIATINRLPSSVSTELRDAKFIALYYAGGMKGLPETLTSADHAKDYFGKLPSKVYARLNKAISVFIQADMPGTEGN